VLPGPGADPSTIVCASLFTVTPVKKTGSGAAVGLGIVLDYAGRAIRRTRTDQSSSAKSVKRFSQEKRVGLSQRNCLKIKEMERFQRVRGTIDSSRPFVRVGMAGYGRLRLEM